MAFRPYFPRGYLGKDSCEHTGESELSWGPGLVPPGFEYAPPSEGGFYRGRSPSMVNPPRRKDVPGYPGEIIVPGRALE